jgi:hypothetical protein
MLSLEKRAEEIYTDIKSDFLTHSRFREAICHSAKGHRSYDQGKGCYCSVSIRLGQICWTESCLGAFLGQAAPGERMRSSSLIPHTGVRNLAMRVSLSRDFLCVVTEGDMTRFPGFFCIRF